MADFLAALKSEIRDIEAELRNDPRFRKWESLRSVLSLYQESGMAEAPSEDQMARTITRAPSENRARALELARLFLRNRSGPTPTRDIYDHIVSNGGEIGGKDPVNNLSAMLSNSDDFQSNGRAGWTLAPEGGQHASIDEQVYLDVSEDILAGLNRDELTSTHSWVTTNRKIPSDVDGHLLGRAREIVGRFLTDKESSTLRGVFTRALEKHVFA
ncbi:MAG: hypothetical protein E5X74_33045 [Mesorhizobium sp.]|uniref:hypothetical protein n=1 Tax=Mesorhizobium sp. TaxID=1871066 RepID=UPI00121CD2A9|nr:hypothetical protein [Mesorhizobium sp.]TIO72180.1 MAG: hypothetical protein E5X75_33505 [Mesorhizobium sp.]TIO80388.1 MAG: hypothetical protein E5X74_33045 [Mesorhizobium sp.]